MNARSLMTSVPAVVAAGATIPQAAELMRTRGVGMLLVGEDDADLTLVGVLTDRDIVVRHVALGHGETAKVRDHMTREPLITVKPSTSVREIADLMTRYQVRRLPVVNERGKVVGVVAQADLAVHVGPKDPELVEEVLEGISRPGALVH
jgi:CBS domain-containing protein